MISQTDVDEVEYKVFFFFLIQQTKLHKKNFQQILSKSGSHYLIRKIPKTYKKHCNLLLSNNQDVYNVSPSVVKNIPPNLTYVYTK